MPFRLVVWNCAGALHRKYEHLLALEPSLAVIPECAEPDILRRKAPDFAFDDVEWGGELTNKGLGVFAFGGLTLRRHQAWERRFHILLPVEVRGPTAINLLAVWAFNRRAQAIVSDPPTTEAAVEHYAPFLAAAPAIVAGDFNANVIWDRAGRYASFAALDATLRAQGLESAYHAYRGEALGEETAPTLYWQKKRHQGYHIDYAYIPAAWRACVRSVDVGAPDPWLARSDHAPLVVDVELPERGASPAESIRSLPSSTPDATDPTCPPASS